jgi:hypothetical protein
MDPKGKVKPPSWYISEPHMGPMRKPMPVAISIMPMFISRSASDEWETINARVATEFIPEPRPPIIWKTKEKNKNQFSDFKPSVQ